MNDYDLELINSLEIALEQQELELQELKLRINILERALKMHVLNYDAHKI